MPLDDQIGGAGAAPGNFRVIGQSPTILVQGVNNTVDAMTITVQENLYGVVFSFTVSRAKWLSSQTATSEGDVPTLASQYAAYVEAIGMQGPVIGISYAQDVNAAGLLKDVLIVTVGTEDGLNSAITTVPLNPASLDAATNAILAAYNRLLAVGGLT